MNIESEIKRFVANNFLFSDGAFDYDNDTSFLTEGIIDSLGVMELVSFVESKFGVRVGPQEVTPDNFDSVNKLSKFISSKLVVSDTAGFNPAGHISL